MTADDAGTVPEAGADLTTTVPAPHQRPARSRRWRTWRRARPFWGGLLLILSGLELLAIPLSGVLVHGAIKLVIYIGIGGVFGVLIGALLIVCGVVTWFNPVNKTFYSIAGVVLGIVSFPASNLGGLFLGMLLAIMGGSLAFAWTPFETARDSQPAAAVPPDAAADEVVPLADLMAGAEVPEAGLPADAPQEDLPADGAAPETGDPRQDADGAHQRETRHPAAENEAALP